MNEQVKNSSSVATEPMPVILPTTYTQNLFAKKQGKLTGKYAISVETAEDFSEAQEAFSNILAQLNDTDIITGPISEADPNSTYNEAFSNGDLIAGKICSLWVDPANSANDTLVPQLQSALTNTCPNNNDPAVEIILFIIAGLTLLTCISGIICAIRCYLHRAQTGHPTPEEAIPFAPLDGPQYGASAAG